jgi:hypothetical protein
MTSMTTTQDNTLVLKDAAGDYFLLPQETLLRSRVPAERRAEIERLFDENQAAEQDDTQGHILPALIIGACWGGSIALAIGYSDRLFGIGRDLDGPLR